MSNVNVPEVHQQERGREAVHYLFGHEERELVAARGNARVVEIVEQRLREALPEHAVQSMAALVDLPAVILVSLVEGGEHLVKEALPVLNSGSLLRADRRLNRLEQELLGQNDVRRDRVAVVAQLAPSDQAETLVGGDHPCFFRRQFALLAQILEERGRRGRLAAEGVHVLPASGDQSGAGVEVPGQALVESLGIKNALGSEVRDEVRDVQPTFGGESILVASPTSESHDDSPA